MVTGELGESVEPEGIGNENTGISGIKQAPGFPGIAKFVTTENFWDDPSTGFLKKLSGLVGNSTKVQKKVDSGRLGRRFLSAFLPPHLKFARFVPVPVGNARFFSKGGDGLPGSKLASVAQG